MKKHNQELEIDEDIQLESTNWVVQRIAWVLMAIVVVAALLGFTGDGGIPGLSKHTVGSEAEGVEITYERFLRRSAPAELEVVLYPSDSGHSPVVSFNKDFYDKIQVRQVIPEPSEVRTHAKGITYTFPGGGLTPVTFYLQPKHAGTLQVDAAVPGNYLSFSQFIYP